VPLSAITSGTTVTVRRIDEEVEAQPEAMRALEDQLLMPGYAVTVMGPDGDRLRLRGDAGDASLPTAVAEKVYASA
jgi:hypothetical protein